MSRPTIQQTGGFAAVSLIQRVLDQFDSPLRTAYGVSMVLLIVYASILPSSVISYADSTLGRLLGLAVVFFTTTRLSWMYGLLSTLAFLVLLRSSTIRAQEGFYGGPVTEKPRIGKRWFVEKVLGEDPMMIATEKAVTQPIQD